MMHHPKQTHKGNNKFLLISLSICKSDIWGYLYKVQNYTLLFLFGLHNQTPKRNQKSKRKR